MIDIENIKLEFVESEIKSWLLGDSPPDPLFVHALTKVLYLIEVVKGHTILGGSEE